MIPIYDDNPALGRPILTIAIIVGCILVWFLQISLGPGGEREAIISFGLVPSAFLGNTFQNGPISPLFTVFTSMFMHGGLMHLGGNMLYLWIFGDNIEGALGHTRFLFFYLICGIAAALAQVFVDPTSNIPMIGASGAVSGVLGAYLIFYPRARVRTLVFLGIFITFLRLPAVFLLGVWIIGQIISAMLSSPGSPGVAWFAHLGGFGCGLILGPLMKKRDMHVFQPARTKVKEKPIRIRFRSK